MRKAIYSFVVGASLGLALLTGYSYARPSEITTQTMKEVVKIAKAISVVNPRLQEAKYVEYGLGIYRAWKRYDIEPAILIAIAQQETGFRENLPEGGAGEWGITQIRKNWLQNAKFKAEFPGATEADLKKPSKSFLMAAWILRDLRKTASSRTLPFWSYYNAVRFENRFKYFLLVNRNISALQKHAASQEELGEDTTGIAMPRTPLKKAAKPAPAPIAAPAAASAQSATYNAPDLVEIRRVGSLPARSAARLRAQGGITDDEAVLPD